MTVTALHREVLDAGLADGWSRPPDFERARRIKKAKLRRAEIIRSGRLILSRKTIGGDDRVLDRMTELHDPYAEYRALGLAILTAELL
jgi:hypothetical protein